MTNQEAIKILKQNKAGLCHNCAHPAMVGWCENHCRKSEAFDMAVEALKAQSDGDTISRQAAIDALMEILDRPNHAEFLYTDEICRALNNLPSAQPEVLACGEGELIAQPEIIQCKDCKYFELDHFEKVEGFPAPIIVAHEICMKWSDGCRTSKDGWCFMGERRTDE